MYSAAANSATKPAMKKESSRLFPRERRTAKSAKTPTPNSTSQRPIVFAAYMEEAARKASALNAASGAMPRTKIERIRSGVRAFPKSGRAE
jgi:hypothetical protein